MKRKTLLLCIFSATAAVSTMAAVIKGRVIDSEGAELPVVTTQLINAKDSTRAGVVLTEADGSFKFDNLKPGLYSLRLTMTGMDNIDKAVQLADSTEIKDLGDRR